MLNFKASSVVEFPHKRKPIPEPIKPSIDDIAEGALSDSEIEPGREGQTMVLRVENDYSWYPFYYGNFRRILNGSGAKFQSPCAKKILKRRRKRVLLINNGNNCS